MPKFKDISGQTFNGIKALDYPGIPGKWNFLCRCGEIFCAYKHNITFGNQKSCGCYVPSNIKTAQDRDEFEDKLYKKFHIIKQRCEDSNHISYPNYGGKGIRLRWSNVNDFIGDMYESFKAHSEDNKGDTTIERIDPKGDYCKSNCIWIKSSEQARNRSNTLWVEFKGDNYCLKDFARKEVGKGSYKRVYKLYKDGYTPSQIITVLQAT